MVASGSDEEVLVGCECEQDDDNVGPVANTLRLRPALEKHREAELSIVEKIDGFVRQLDGKDETELDVLQSGSFIAVANSSLYKSLRALLRCGKE